MSENSESLRSVEDVLATASSGIPRTRPDLAASRARLLAHAAGLPRLPAGTGPDPGGAPEDHDGGEPFDADEAAHRLDALCAAVSLSRTAGSSLAAFAEYAGADPEGALVFACVLHLAGDGDGAAFWWRLAAGAEQELAAYCLFLDHSRHGEYHDAAVWSRRLTDADALHALSGDSPLPPPRLRQALTRIGRWTSRHDHEDLGTVLLATPGLAKEVFALAPAEETAPGGWMVPHPMAPAPRPRQERAAPATDGRAARGPSAHGRGTPSEGAAKEPAPGAGAAGPAAEPSAAFSVRPLRHTTLAALAQRMPDAPHAPDRWTEAMRVLDVLHAVRGARRPLGPAEIASAAGRDGVDVTRLLAWLRGHHLLSRLPDGSYTVGALFSPAPAGDAVLRHGTLVRLLDELRDTTGAAVYFSRYTDGEIDIQHCSDGPATPAINQWVDLREAAHASANGKSLMAQLDFDGRMDHLARHRPYALTERTITDPAALFRALDGHGPHASQFDVLEYSRREVCVAVPVALDGRPACVALSLPSGRSSRLVEAARVLSGRSALILLTLLAVLPAAPAPEEPAGNVPAPSGRPRPGAATPRLLLPEGPLSPAPAGFLTGTR